MSNDQQQLGPIEADKLYPLEVFQHVSGLGKAALRTARQAGLKVHYVSGRGWVTSATIAAIPAARRTSACCGRRVTAEGLEPGASWLW